MKLPIDKQIEFLQWQIKELEIEYNSYLNKQMSSHFTEGSAYVGKLWSVDRSRGNLIIRFPKKMTPRLNNPYAAYMFKEFQNDELYHSWSFNYKLFRQNYSIFHFEVMPIYYLNNNDPNFNFIGFRDVDQEVLQKIDLRISEGKNMPVVIAEKEPPFEYLENLISLNKKLY